MNIWQKLFGKKTKKESEQENQADCWYNNIHENPENTAWEPIEGATSPNGSYLDMGITKNIAQK